MYPASGRAAEIATKVETFVTGIVIPYARNPRRGSHGPSDDPVQELRTKAWAAGVLTPLILEDCSHLSQRKTAAVFKRSDMSPLGSLVINTMAPDESNMDLIGKVGSSEITVRFLQPLIAAEARSAFFMTAPAEDDGAGSDPSMMKTKVMPDGNQWVITGRKALFRWSILPTMPERISCRRTSLQG